MKAHKGCSGVDALSLDINTGCLHRMILDIAHIGILVTDSKGNIKYLNPAFSTMFDIEIEFALGKNINDYFPKSQLLDVIRSGIPHKAIRFSYRGQDALINRYPITNGDKTIGGLIEVYFRDINVLKDLVQQMTDLEKKVLYYKRKAQGLPGAKYTFDDIIGQSDKIRDLKNLGLRFATSSQPVLLYGESGSGKELVAHAIHAYSQRANEIFIRVNCAAIPKDLMESELFGFEEGTFTGAKVGGKVGKFELADKGTIFLDEIAELPFEMQAKLLRVIENKEIQKIGTSISVYSDFRLIAATNKELATLVREGTFREDLYHRLHILVLQVPPLRERSEDILLLIPHLLRELEDKPHNLDVSFSPEVKQLLQGYAWPGNIRELRNVLSFAILSLDDGQNEIRLRNLPPYLVEKGILKVRLFKDDSCSLIQAREKSEKEALLAAMERSPQNKSKAAKILGISRNELYKKIKKYSL
jgi:transcriptional regulator with PAS, ATPase and Fis domain